MHMDVCMRHACCVQCWMGGRRNARLGRAQGVPLVRTALALAPPPPTARSKRTMDISGLGRPDKYGEPRQERRRRRQRRPGVQRLECLVSGV